MTKGVGCVYQALYRKYRPQTFSDVVGQKGVTDTLRAQLETLQLLRGLQGHRRWKLHGRAGN